LPFAHSSISYWNYDSFNPNRAVTRLTHHCEFRPVARLIGLVMAEVML